MSGRRGYNVQLLAIVGFLPDSVSLLVLTDEGKRNENRNIPQIVCTLSTTGKRGKRENIF